jgi:hypothetical protein
MKATLLIILSFLAAVYLIYSWRAVEDAKLELRRIQYETL